MRKLLLPLLTLLSLTACNKTPDMPNPEAGGVKFTTDVNAFSRATDSDFEEGDAISVSAYNQNGNLFRANAEYIYTNGYFASTNPIHYPVEDGSALAFSAVYPMTEVAEDKTFDFAVLTDQSSHENYTKSDLMTAYVSTTTDEVPQLTFSHRAAKVILNVQDADVTLQGATTEVHAMTSLSANLDDMTFEGAGDIETIKACDNGTNSFKAIIAPQLIEAGDILASFSIDGKPYDLKMISDIDFLSGKQYTANISIKSGKAVIISGIIDPWEDEDDLGAIFRIRAHDATNDGYLVDVKTSESYTGNYTMIPVTYSDLSRYSSLKEYAKAQVASLQASCSIDWSSVDNAYVFNGTVMDHDIRTAWNLPYGQYFYTLVVGVEGGADQSIITTEPYIDGGISTVNDDIYDDIPEEFELSTEEFGEVKVTSTNYRGMSATVTPANEKLPFVFYIFDENSYLNKYPTDNDRIRYIYEFYTYGGAYFGLTFLDMLNQQSHVGVYDHSQVNDLVPGTKYYTYAFGIDSKSGQPMTEIDVQEFTLPSEPEVTGTLNSLTISNISYNDATATIDATGFDGNYIAVVMDRHKLEDDWYGCWNNNIEGAFENEVFENFIKNNWSLVPVPGSEFYLFSGNKEVSLKSIGWDMTPNTEYVVLVGGVQADGFAITNVLKSEAFSTIPVPALEIAISVDDITDESAAISFVANQDVERFYADVVKKSDLEAFASPEDYVRSLDGWVLDHLYYGGYWPSKTLEPGTEYVALAMGWNTGSKEATTEVFKVEFSTTGGTLPDLEKPEEVLVPYGKTFDFELNVTMNAYGKMTYTYVPKDSDALYYYGYASKEEFESEGFQERFMMDTAFYNFWYYGYQYGSYRQGMNAVCKRGEYTNSIFNLSVGTEYAIFAVEMDEWTGQPATELTPVFVTSLAE